MTGDELHEAVVRAELTTQWLGRHYHYVESIGSTNNRLKEWLADGSNPPAGTVLLTDHQTAGRGRLDRRWEAPPATSLLFSILFRPGWPAEKSGRLTMLAGLAVAEAIEAVAGLDVRLKWPNDIMLRQDGGWAKAAGLLLDAVVENGKTLESAVLGIGINVNIPIEALPEAITPPTSLLVACGRPVARRPLLLACLNQLEHHYDAAGRGISPWAAWNERLITLGRAVTVTAAGTKETLTGVAEATNEMGHLIVRDGAGHRHTVTAGDVTLRDN